MKAAHQVYKRARETVLAAKSALSDAGSPVDDTDDSFEAEREALRAATEGLRTAEEPIAEEIEAAWQRNVGMVQAAKQACRDAIAAALQVEKGVAEAVMKRRLGPWPAGAPLITEVEQQRLDNAKQAMDAAIDANTAAEARFKEGVTAENLTGSV